jgi:hypothetical protein
MARGGGSYDLVETTQFASKANFRVDPSPPAGQTCCWDERQLQLERKVELDSESRRSAVGEPYQ